MRGLCWRTVLSAKRRWARRWRSTAVKQSRSSTPARAEHAPENCCKKGRTSRAAFFMTYAGSNVTGTAGLIAVDKVGNNIRFYDPQTIREIGHFDAPEPCAHELAISHDHKTAFVPLYGDGIYGGNKNPNNKILVIDLVS